MGPAWKPLCLVLSLWLAQSRRVRAVTRVDERIASDAVDHQDPALSQLRVLEAEAAALATRLNAALEFKQADDNHPASPSSSSSSSGAIEVALQEELALAREAAELKMRLTKFYTAPAAATNTAIVGNNGIGATVVAAPGVAHLSEACRLFETVHDFRELSQLSECYMQLHNVYATQGDTESSRRVGSHVYQHQQLAVLGFSPL
jgi:hypothetical protein